MEEESPAGLVAVEVEANRVMAERVADWAMVEGETWEGEAKCVMAEGGTGEREAD